MRACDKCFTFVHEVAPTPTWTPAAARTACDNCMWRARRVARAQAWTGATQRDCRVKSLRLVGLELLQGEHTKQISSVAQACTLWKKPKVSLRSGGGTDCTRVSILRESQRPDDTRRKEESALNQDSARATTSK